MSKLTENECCKEVCEKVFRYLPEDFREKNGDFEGMIGIEVEMLLAKTSNNKVESLKLYGDNSLSELLSDFKLEGDKVSPVSIDNKLFSIQLSNGGQLTFEPGAQLEYSTKPYACLSDAVTRLRQVQDKIERIALEVGAEVYNLGINPWQTVDQIGLQMNKPRYKAMDAYFNSISTYGRRMMRQTCTVQVNVDFGKDEQTLVKRFLASQYLAPFMTAIFANSPVVDNKLTEFKSFRSKVWQELDPSRTGFVDLKPVEENPTKKACVDTYFEALMEGHVIFIEKLDYEVPEEKITFREWLKNGYKGVYPTLKDFETHSTLFFPEVRAKRLSRD